MISIGSGVKSNQIKKYERVVLSILLDRLDARDDDYALYFYVLAERNVDLKSITGYELLVRISKGTLPSIMSVSRARRRVQEFHPSARGEKWEQRRERAKAVRDEMTE